MMNKQQILNEQYGKPILTKRGVTGSALVGLVSPQRLNIDLHNCSMDLLSENDTVRHVSMEMEEKLNYEINQHFSIESISQRLKVNEDKDEHIKMLQDKLAQSNAKLYECKNNCMLLRREINKAQKIICHEVGENVTIASLSRNHLSGGWRGRSQQIQQLQQKVIELQKKMNEPDRLSKSSSTFSEQKSIINREKEKKQQIESLRRELKQSELTCENNKKKLEAAKARIRVLENDLCTTRSNLILVNEKKLLDQQLIEALNGQLRAVKSKYCDKEIEIKKQRDKLQHNCDELKNELSTVKFQVEQLRKKIGERETEIDTLRSNKSKRVSESSSTVTSVQESAQDLKYERIMDPDEYVIMCLAAEAEQERLLELVTALNRRLDKERIETDHLSELVRNEKHKNARLEKRIQQMQTERSKASKIDAGYRARFSKSFNDGSSSKERLNTEEMQNKLELLKEESLALKARLLTIQQDKATDLTIYKQMLESTKKIFQDACRNKTKMTRGHSTVTI